MRKQMQNYIMCVYKNNFYMCAKYISVTGLQSKKYLCKST